MLWLAVALLASAAVARQAEADRATPARFGLRADAVEVEEARSEHTKRFRLPNGSLAEVATGRPLHYRDADGQWRESRPGLAARGGGELVADALPFRVRVQSDGVAIGTRDASRGMVFLTDDAPGAAGTTISARPGRGGLAWSWEVGASEVKLTSAPVPRPVGVREYDFPYRLWGGFDPPGIGPDGALTSGGFVFGRPCLLGADGASYEAVRWVTRPDAATLALRVDDRDLPGRAYPYRIDPAIGPQPPSIVGLFTNNPYAPTSYSWQNPSYAITNNNAKAKSPDLPVGAVTQGLYLHGFDFDQLADAAAITGITVRLDRETTGCGGCQASDCIVEDQLYLTKDGQSVVGANRAGSECWPLAANQFRDFGGDGDLWGTTWTAEEIRNTAFGPIVSARLVSTSGGDAPDAGVDFVSITVHWRQPDPGPGAVLATEDTFIRGGSPNINEGATTILRVRESEDNRALVRFAPADIVAAVGAQSVVKAELQLSVQFNAANWGPGRPVDVHRLTAEWDAGRATWNCAADSDPGNGTADCAAPWNGGTFVATPTDTVLHNDATSGWATFDVTADVAAILATPSAPHYG